MRKDWWFRFLELPAHFRSNFRCNKDKTIQSEHCISLGQPLRYNFWACTVVNTVVFLEFKIRNEWDTIVFWLWHCHKRKNITRIKLVHIIIDCAWLKGLVSFPFAHNTKSMLHLNVDLYVGIRKCIFKNRNLSWENCKRQFYNFKGSENIINRKLNQSQL